MRNNGPKKIALVTLVVAVIGLTVAFAILSSNLNISGSAYVDPVKWGIYFDDLSGADEKGNAKAETIAEIMTDSMGAKTKIGNMNISLNIPGDKVIYTVDLINEGSIPVEVAEIVKPNTGYDYITFKVTYTGTNNEVKVGDVIEPSIGDNLSIYNLTITIDYDKELVNVLPTDVLNIALSYELKFTQTEKEVNIPTTEKKFVFPEVIGKKLGDNIKFDYKVDPLSVENEYMIEIKGSGEMYDEKLTDDSECKSYSTASDEACSLGSEIAMEVIKKLNPSSFMNDTVSSVNKIYFPIYIMGNDQVEGVYPKETYKTLLMTSGTISVSDGGIGLTQKQLDKLILILDNIPKISRIIIDNRVTSIRSSLFSGLKIDRLEFSNNITKFGDSSISFADIDQIAFGTGTTTLEHTISASKFKKLEIPEGIKTLGTYFISNSSGFSEIVIPKSVESISQEAIYYSDDNLERIVNKTGNPFDWNGILLREPGEPFVVGTATNGTKSIQIVDNE